MKTFGRTLVVGSFAIATAVAGTATAWPGSSPAAPDEAQDKGGSEPSETQDAGVGRVVEQALGRLSLSPEQKDAVARLRSSLAEREAPVLQARADFMSTLADELAAGHVDRAALEPKIDAFANAVRAASPAMRGALQELHGVLTPAQRAQFVSALRQSMKSEKADAASHKAMLQKLVKDLDLTREQRRELHEAFEHFRPAMAAARDNLEKLLDSFESDTLSVDQIVPAREVSASVVGVAHAIVDLAADASAVLTTEQREKVAAAIRQAIQTPGAQPGTSSGEQPSPTSGEEQGDVGAPGNTEGGTSTEEAGKKGPLWGGWHGRWGGRRRHHMQPDLDDVIFGGGYAPYGSGYGYSYGYPAYGNYGVPYYGGWGYVW